MMTQMEKMVYVCGTCKKNIHTQLRDKGLIPDVIGCNAQGCKKGECKKSPTSIPIGEPELTFIRPNSKVEWEAIIKELMDDIVHRYPKAKQGKIRRLTNKHMGFIQNFVYQGGLIMLPTMKVVAIESVLTVGKN